MTSYKLPRTGQAPLAFEGEELARSDGRWANGVEQNRWHTLAVYRTDGGNYVLAIHYRTQWQGEQHDDRAIVLGQDAHRLAEELERYDPTTVVQGFPPGSQYAEKQRRLLESIERRYRQQVSELLSKVPGAEERID
ncbi:hypothetical protein [Candidatus Nitrospira bockiana]